MEEFVVYIAKLPEDVPTEFQVLPYGTVKLENDEPAHVDEQAMDAVIEHFKFRQLPMSIDYEHQTLDGREAPAAGWIKELVNRGKDGLWAKVEWTKRAAEYLKNREYRFHSPVMIVDKATRRLKRIYNLGLTNVPRINGLKPIVARDDITGKEEDMPVDLLNELIKLLGLDEGATPEAVIEKVTELQKAAEKATKGGEPENRPVAAKSVLDVLGLDEAATESEVVASLHALKSAGDEDVIAKLQTRVSELSDELAERKKDELVAAALQAGKITPAQKEWAAGYAKRDPKGFELYVAKAPVLIDTGKTYRPAPEKPEDGLDDVQLEVNKMLGVDTETWKKYAPKEKEEV